MQIKAKMFHMKAKIHPMPETIRERGGVIGENLVRMPPYFPFGLETRLESDLKWISWLYGCT